MCGEGGGKSYQILNSDVNLSVEYSRKPFVLVEQMLLTST